MHITSFILASHYHVNDSLKKFIFFLFVLIALFYGSLASAANVEDWQTFPHGKARMFSGTIHEDSTTFSAGLEFFLEPGWKLYWRTPGDSGIPLTIQWQGSENLKDLSLLWPFPTRHIEDNLHDFVYKHHVVFPLLMTKIKSNAPINLRTLLHFAICEKLCIPIRTSFALSLPSSLPSSPDDLLIEEAQRLVPKSASELNYSLDSLSLYRDKPHHYTLKLTLHSQEIITQQEVFIEGDRRLRFLKASQQSHASNPRKAVYHIPLETSLPEAELAGKTITLTLGVTPIVSITETLQLPPVSTRISFSFLWVLMTAFVGGLILNVMPCVLPVLSLKILSIIKHPTASLRVMRLNFFMTILGILASFWLIGTALLLLKATGQMVGFGFQFQQPLFLIFLIITLIIFTCNLWGYFEFQLPHSLANHIDRFLGNYRTTYIGSFFSGMFATLLATPCSAPFLGTAISAALILPPLGLLAIFTMVGLGFSFPYMALSLFPNWRHFIPKPGAWMIRLQRVLGLLLLLTALWLIYVVWQQLGWEAGALVFLCCLLIKFILQQHSPRFTFPIKLLSLTLAIALCFILPIKTHHKQLSKQERVQTVWEPFIESRIPGLVKQGKTVIIDITADWCLTCKTNKLLVLDQEDILKHLQSPHIVSMRGDLTTPNPTIMAFLERHQRYAIPFNVVYGPGAPEGIVLPELLTKQSVIKAIQKAKP